jgi:hypothetical protein
VALEYLKMATQYFVMNFLRCETIAFMKENPKGNMRSQGRFGFTTAGDEV